MKTFPLDRLNETSVAAAYAAAQAEIEAMRKAGTPPALIVTGDASIDVYAPGDALPLAPEPGPAPLPDLPWRSFFDLLDATHLRAASDAWLATAPQRARDEWGRTQSFQREHPLLVYAISDMGLDPAVIDAAWLAQAARDGIA